MQTETAIPDSITETEAADRLSPLWIEIDQHAHWPAFSDEIHTLLREGAGMDISIETLEDWARNGQVGKVSVRGGRFAWGPTAVLRAAALCEVSRRWIPLHPKHAHKFSAAELGEAQASELGETIFSDIDTVDCRSLLGIISSTQDSNLRSVLCVALRTKLKQAGIV